MHLWGFSFLFLVILSPQPQLGATPAAGCGFSRRVRDKKGEKLPHTRRLLTNIRAGKHGRQTIVAITKYTPLLGGINQTGIRKPPPPAKSINAKNPTSFLEARKSCFFIKYRFSKS